MPASHRGQKANIDDKPACECGLFGIYGNRRAAEYAYFGLYSLQHRGQESCGIVSANGTELFAHRGMGEINEVFYRSRLLKNLKGSATIGHNRYSTTGASSEANIQPLLMTNQQQKIAAAHNGNITNSRILKRKLEKSGAIFQTTSDSELVLHFYARSKKRGTLNKLADSLNKLQGAYCFVFLTRDKLYAARDPFGFRPLCLGKRARAWVIASESCAFDIIGARYVRDIQPGEIIEISKNGVRSKFMPPRSRHAFCIFEHIYFARPDSRIFEENVDKVRRRLGHRLAIEQPVEADIVISVPDSSNTAAMGFSEESGIKLEVGLIRNHYVGRTFIMPEQKVRDLDVKVKFNPVRGVLKGRRVVVVDDSIVRGTTARKLVKLIRQAGVKQVHFRISSPPIISPCFYGIDMPTKKELIASDKSVERIRRYLGVDSLGYLSLKGMLQLSKHRPSDFCTACFSGKYRTHIENNHVKNLLG
jgi:amidophosphoribosyltransferase